MTSIEVPYSIAAALPTLAVLDITNEIAHEIADGDCSTGIAYVTATQEDAVVRVNEREAGFFCDVEELFARLLPLDTKERARMLLMLLGPRTEQVPFTAGVLNLGTYQRILLFGFGEVDSMGWRLTVVG